MKKLSISTFILFFFIAMTSNAFAFGFWKHGSIDDLKYPIVLVHGWAGSNKFVKTIDYFWNIKNRLEHEGADVYVVDMDAFNSSEVRGRQLKTFVLNVLATTGQNKVNLIAHSQGGLSARYMISNLGMADKVASLVMISTPNRGTALCDVIVEKLPPLAEWALDGLMSTFWGGLICGDDNPDFYASTYEMTHENMEQNFNPNTPDSSRVKYYSYAGKMYGASANIVLTPSWAILSYYDGANDGIVPVSSAKWGNWKGVKTGIFGIDHFMEINHIFGNTAGFDTPGFYVDIANMLSKDGF